jgi:hypothetical protein
VNSHRVIVSSTLLGLASLLIGCGREEAVERFPIHGTVTFANGEKLNGSITFLPAKGRPGPAATTALVEGSYRFDRSNGPAAGPHTVKIMKRNNSRSRIPKSPSDGQAAEKTRMEWTESTDVSDDGPYLHDFTLEN